MPRRQEVPDELERGPFTIADAERAGLDRFQLRSRNWRRLDRGTYVWARLEADPDERLSALHSRLPRGSVFSGLTAARLHGFADGESAIEVTMPPTSRCTSKRVSASAWRRSIRATSPCAGRCP